MGEVDYLKLSDQYASFLVAVGGVSITALALVLSFGSESIRRVPRVFLVAALVAALVVATASCFIGAHMMAETAAFITYAKDKAKDAKDAKDKAKEKAKEKAERELDDNALQSDSPSTEEIVSGQRLFVLASTNIFVAVMLVLFALMLLPAASGIVDAASITPISVSVFGFVGIGAIIWMILAAINRTPPPNGWYITAATIIVDALWILGLYVCFKKYLKYLLWASFIPIILATVALLIYFACTFNDGGKVHDRDIIVFSLIITLSCISLVAASIKSMRDNVITTIETIRDKKATKVELLEQGRLPEEVGIGVFDLQLGSRAARKPRDNWDAAFQAMAQNGDDTLLDAEEAHSLSSWDETEWEW